MGYNNKDYVITVKILYTKQYAINASHPDIAEDLAIEEAYADEYDPKDLNCDVEVYETELG